MPGSVHHVGTTVADLERAVDFYTETFDLEVLAEFESTGEAFSTGVGVENATGRFAHLDGDDTRVELVEYEPAGGEAAAGSYSTSRSTTAGPNTSGSASTTSRPSTRASRTTSRR